MDEHPSRHERNERRREERDLEPATVSLPPTLEDTHDHYVEDPNMLNRQYSGVNNTIAGGPSGGDSRNAKKELPNT